MNLDCTLIEKTFNTPDGENRKYYVLKFTLADGSNLEVSVKGDKAKLLIMSHNFVSKTSQKLPDIPFFDKDDLSALNN